MARFGGIDILVANAGITGPERADVGVSAGRVAAGPRDRPDRHLPVLPGGRAGDARRSTTAAS